MYDYVIVGAGSAGCVLANRLSEDPDVRVLLVEAGPPDTADFIHIPAAFSALFRTQHDWDHMTGWEPGAHGRRIYLPRGRMLGGSSSLNAMIYMRGNPLDYDEWRDAGCTGWGWDDLLPYFKRAEDNERGASEFHGAGGPLPVSEPRARSKMCQAFLEAVDALGLPRNDDFNDGEQDGYGWYQLTQRDGRRASTAVAYLHPVADRPNLTIETYAQVLKVAFDGSRAVGVVAQRAGDVLEWRAEREVIVCGGAYNSPQLLMLSGIGRPDELELLQIPLVAESPEVGMNLQDHPTAGVTYFCQDESSLKDALNDANLAQWMQGQGPLTSNIGENGGFARTRDDLPAPDVQFHMVPVVFEQEGLLAPPAHGFTLSACVLKPASRGMVAIGTPDPTAKPFIVHGYYTAEDDVRSGVAGLRMVLDFVRTAPLSRYAETPNMAPASDDDAELERHMRQNCQTIYHPVGTCRMGADATAVVDPELRVRGVDGLRVVDASIMPTVPRGNTNAPVIAVAERAADLIRGRQPAETTTASSSTA
jgi:choline dehydrogenase-like flavoprotein